jgi:two-component system, NtrC family, response regulator AlgB
MNVLLIDDDPDFRCSFRLLLESLQHRITEADCGNRARQLLAQTDFDVAFLDLRLSKENGLQLLPELLQIAPGLTVIVLTADPTVETAVEAMRRGAFDYLAKPCTPQQLRRVLDRSIPVLPLQSSWEDVERQVCAIAPEAHLQTKDAVMRWRWQSKSPPAMRPCCCAAKAAPARACWHA